ncbi:MAG: sugar phosphate isomerase/epimerase [Lentisphaerae bacterium]|jgi:sugar phosphate isomerase/epimerase|nr:sugar phosphate isomerase/epimerase [Lentisphaerota bacterium]MBT4818182.1 sugar phosphate isomerase/epimerase [Lentisphaerota bacterium]MBT5610367.1 sugar phosphate isomerase/epimerase [Lentisphaerota bacterium]MBT7056195.1 sugar phosphate isomerase/epimerase [Lentisphaerota bacterium]MBT7841883.1 sugar phosphate isomerase/epimerase [Lentisphaerota bacterium]
MKFGVADYGMNVWDGGCFDIQARLEALRDIGFEGTERLSATSSGDALLMAATYRRMGMDFATLRAPDMESTIRWTAGLGRDYVWVSVTGKDMDTFCRQASGQARACARWGLRVGLHNHLGQLVESHDQVVQFLEACPECGLVLDTAHLAAAGGDPVEIVRRYPRQLVAIHLKDWLETNPEIGLERWPQRGRFCELGAGNIGLDNAAVMAALVDVGYDGWVHVEHDTHLQEPVRDLAISRQYLRDAGF